LDALWLAVFNISTCTSGHLSVLIEHLESEIRAVEGIEREEKKEKEAIRLTDVLKEAKEEVTTLLDGTEKKIHGFVSDVFSDQDAALEMEEKAKKDGRQPKMSRKKILGILSEIVQELCQPLSVISCSIDMVTSKCLGDVPDVQVEILNTASQSASRMEVLVKEIEKISGIPDSRTPDAKILGDVYKGKNPDKV
ncbi:hypothetical protein ACFLS1_12695, partial [Verrucomicrobiota bacterium]